jgi:hypothetical protein
MRVSLAQLVTFENVDGAIEPLESSGRPAPAVPSYNAKPDLRVRN